MAADNIRQEAITQAPPHLGKMGALQVLYKTKCVVNCGMNVARGNGIADAKKLEAAGGIGGDPLRSSGSKCVIVDFAAIA